MQLNSATLLTLFRIALIPVLVVFFFLPYGWTNWACAGIFGLAAITDWADGYVARRYDQVSRFGEFLDPVADKLMVTVTLVLLVQYQPSPWFVIPAVVIIGREITISALREWMAGIGERGTVRVATLGKLKTIVQMVALLLLLLRETIGPLPTFLLGHIGLWVAAVLTIWSMIVYLRAAWPAARTAGD